MNKYDFKDTNVYINESKMKDYNTIYGVCKCIASNKHSTEVNNLLVEELAELIKAVMKLERWNRGDEFLRCDYHDIYDNIYEEISDVIITLLQFISKNRISYDCLIDEIGKKLVRIYETKFGEK